MTSQQTYEALNSQTIATLRNMMTSRRLNYIHGMVKSDIVSVLYYYITRKENGGSPK